MMHDQTYQLTQHYAHQRDSNAYTKSRIGWICRFKKPEPSATQVMIAEADKMIIDRFIELMDKGVL